jgi:alkylation response protein AidB-like acyl-CoA dehydrogenase
MTLHSKVAEAEAAINAAAAILKTDAARIMAIAEAGEIFDMETRLALRRNAAYAAKLSVGAVDDIVSAAGGAALFDTNPLSRTFRDAHACLAHITMNWEANAVPAGRQSLGLDSEATLL